MGLMDKIRGLFNGSNNTPVVQEDRYAKSRLATDIVNLVGKINRINCFDGSIRGLANMSSYELERKSMEELEQLHANLSNKYDGLVQQRQRNNERNEAAIAAKWTGQRTAGMTEHDLDHYQRGD